MRRTLGPSTPGRKPSPRRVRAARAPLGAGGFTLAEMMVVLTVVGLVLAVGVPATMKYMRSSEVAGARNTLMADLHYAHSLATMRRRTYEISFTTTTYTIAQVSPASTILTRTMPGGVVCAATDTATFFAWGLSVPVSVTVKYGSDSTTVQLAANGSVSHD